jgi:hypothetical protein
MWRSGLEKPEFQRYLAVEKVQMCERLYEKNGIGRSIILNCEHEAPETGFFTTILRCCQQIR